MRLYGFTLGFPSTKGAGGCPTPGKGLKSCLIAAELRLTSNLTTRNPSSRAYFSCSHFQYLICCHPRDYVSRYFPKTPLVTRLPRRQQDARHSNNPQSRRDATDQPPNMGSRFGWPHGGDLYRRFLYGKIVLYPSPLKPD